MALDLNEKAWLVLDIGPGHLVVQAPEGEQEHSIESAQANAHRYSLLEAQALATRMGPPWRVNHYMTLVPPNEHEDWLKRGKRTNWGP